MTPFGEPPRALPIASRIGLVVAALATWWALQYGAYPAKARLHRTLMHFDGPQERFVAHAFTFWLPTTLGYVAVWALLARVGWMPSPAVLLSWGPSRSRTLRAGLVATAAALALGSFAVLASGGPVWHPSPWLMLGNVFSNLYEEIEYRGFLLLAFRSATRSDAAAVVISSALFGIVHGPNPVMVIGAGLVGVIFAVAYRSSGSLAAPWLAHQVSDMVLDTIVA